MKCFRCEKDKEQLLTVDNKELNFNQSICFPCVVKCLKDYKQKKAEDMVKSIMEANE
tara:strand:- start:84 stop:254 length:171 start_codon:yes stop_codon:yes gene_type:complete